MAGGMDERGGRCYQARNRMVVYVFSAVVAGFLAALSLGAFAAVELREVPPWLSAFTAMIAAFISAYAVYLVSQTLSATRATLDATRMMAEDQRRLGDTQLRAWVFYDSSEVRDDDAIGNMEVLVSLKNYGNPPALNLCAQCIGMQVLPGGDIIAEDAEDDHLRQFPPGTKLGLSTSAMELSTGSAVITAIRWEYQTVDGQNEGSEIILAVRQTDDGLRAEPMAESDFLCINGDAKGKVKEHLESREWRLLPSLEA